jgi:protein-disulfide isomerase
LGNPNAKIKIVEYSDASCPFCKIFHATMLQVMTEYGKTGNVAWVYRHFPLDQADENGNILHKNAGTEAQAMECAADLGGNDKFWAYANRLYSITPSVTNATPEGLNPAQLPEIAVYAGLDKTEFKTCLSSGKNKAEVDADYLEGINAGVSGTPYSVIITANGKQIPVNGAQSYATLKNALDGLLGQ